MKTGKYAKKFSGLLNKGRKVAAKFKPAAEAVKTFGKKAGKKVVNKASKVLSKGKNFVNKKLLPRTKKAINAAKNVAKKGVNKVKKAFGNKSPKKPKRKIRIKNPLKELRIDGKQLGKKFGKHKTDYPNMDYKAYQNYAKQIFDSPENIVKDKLKGEIYYIKGDDLLRVKNNGDFVSLYPGANSDRVISAIKRKGK